MVFLETLVDGAFLGVTFFTSTLREYRDFSLATLFFLNMLFFNALSNKALTSLRDFWSGFSKNFFIPAFILILKALLTFLFFIDFLSDFFADIPIGIEPILAYRHSIYNNLQYQ